MENQHTSGQFVRVRSDHPDTHRAGLDGMVYLDNDVGNVVALVFGCARHGRNQRAQCVGPELWEKWELDAASVY